MMQENLTQMAVLVGGCITVGTACSGTDVVVLVLKRLIDFWNTQFGCSLTLRHLFSCECVAFKQEFITAHFQPEMLYADIAELGSGLALDILSGEMKATPSPHCLAVGIECDTLSGLNSQSEVGEQVCETGSGKTGSTAKATLEYIARARPLIVLLENVKNLGAAGGSGAGQCKATDLEILITKLNFMGYIASWQTLRASDFGVPQSRERIYIVAFLAVSDDSPSMQVPANRDDEPAELPEWWHQVGQLIREMKIETIPIEDFLLDADDDRLGAWERHRNASSAAKSEKSKTKAASAKSDKLEKTTEVDHIQAFEEADLPWPPKWDGQFQEKVQHLCPRMAQVVYFFEQMALNTLKTEGKSPVNFKLQVGDVNMSMKWCRFLEDTIPCLVGSSHMWLLQALEHNGCDYKRLGGRDMIGEEALNLQCFPQQALNQEFMSKLSPRDAMDLAGNAFCGAKCAAVITAAFCFCPWETSLQVQSRLMANPAAPMVQTGTDSSDEEDGESEVDRAMASSSEETS
jgi:site-specific DNA-cytosine methylase